MCYLIAMKPLLAIVLLLVTSCPSWAQEDNPELRKQFLRGVEETARNFDNLSFRAKCVRTTQLAAVSEKWKAKNAEQFAKKQKDPHRVRTRKFDVAIRGPLGLASRIRKSGNISFGVRNGVYAFALEQSPENERTTLQFVEKLGVDPAIDARVAELEGKPRNIIMASFTIGAKLLSQQIESDAFSIQRAYAVSAGDRELVRVEYEYHVDEPVQGRKYRVTNSFLVCDPAQQWALIEYGGTSYNYRDESTTVHHTVLRNRELIDGIPIAMRASTTISPYDDPGTMIETVTTIDVTDHDIPKEEFYLSFYGLPEPNFGETWFGTWGWYLIGGIACIAVGVIIKSRLSES